MEPTPKDNLSQLHENLIKDGHHLPDLNQFKLDMKDSTNLSDLHKNLIKEGYQLPNQSQFFSDMGFVSSTQAKTKDKAAPIKQEPAPKPEPVIAPFLPTWMQKNVASSTADTRIANTMQKAQQVVDRPKIKKAQEERLKKNTQTGIDNTARKQLQDSGITFTEGDGTWNKKKQEIAAAINEGNLVLTTSAKTGEPIMKRPLGFFGSIAEGISTSWNDEKESDKFGIASDDEKIAMLEKEQKESDVLPSGVGGSFGSFLGGAAEDITKVIAGTAIGAAAGTEVPIVGNIIGGVIGGSIAMSTSTVPKGYKREVTKRYMDGISQFTLKGITPTKEQKIEILDKAKKQGYTASAVEAAKAVAFSAIVPGVGGAAGKAAVSTAERGFATALKTAAKNTAFEATKMAGIGATGSIVNDASAKLRGYNVTTGEAASNAFNELEEGGKMAVMFGVVHQSISAVGSIPKYLKASTLNYFSTLQESSVISNSMALEKAGKIPEGNTQKLIAELHAFKAATKRVPIALNQSEHASSFIGLIQKKINLEKSKTESDPTFHPAIDEHIKAVDNQLTEMTNSKNPSELEVDDLTGSVSNPDVHNDEHIIQTADVLTVKPKEIQVEEVLGDAEQSATVIEKLGQEKLDEIATKHGIHGKGEAQLGESAKLIAEEYKLAKEYNNNPELVNDVESAVFPEETVKPTEQTTEQPTTITVQAKMPEISETEHANFIDNGLVTEERINDIAEKIKNKEQLTDRETEMYNEKVNEINKSLQQKNALEPLAIEIKEQTLESATPEDIATELQKIKQENDTRTSETGATEATTGTTGEVLPQPETEGTPKPPTHTEAGFTTEEVAREEYGRDRDDAINETYEEFLWRKLCGEG